MNEKKTNLLLKKEMAVQRRTVANKYIEKKGLKRN